MDFKGQKAIYLQIADHILEQVLLRQLLPFAKIPSVRELAITLAVNPNTIMRAYNFLEDKKIIAIQRGIGYFVQENARPKALALKKEEFINTDLKQTVRYMQLLGINIPELVKLCEDHAQSLGADITKGPL